MKQARQVVLPAYLLLCLILGGSAQAIWGNAILQVMAVAILALSALTREPQLLTRAGKQLLMFAAALSGLFLLQLLPLPPAIWTSIPGRQFMADGFDQLGMPRPWMPISEAPYDTLTTALTLLPPAALLVGMLRLRGWSNAWMLGAIVVAAVLSVFIGVLQVTGDGSWYFYRITNLGVAVGTFANGNHFATLLLVSIPVLAAITATGLQSGTPQRRSLAGVLGAGAAAALAVGALMNSSAAFLLLGPPVAAASVLLLIRLSPTRLRQAALAIALLLVLATGSLAILGSRFPGWGTTASIQTRTTFWNGSARVIEKEGLLGTGFGTFQKAYARYEDPAAVDRFYVNHAHNDYIEIAMEGGVPAVILTLVFLIWWFGRAREAWAAPISTAEQRAAAIAAAAILVHSLFDYPLRTAAIMAVMVVCLALLAGARQTRRTTKSLEPKARHATL